MKPENYRKRSRQARSRGRMFLKSGLGWLRGFPIAQKEGSIDWLCFPGDSRPVEKICLERERLRRATYTCNKLFYRFPRVLTILVEDKDRWIAGVQQLLAWLKQAVHEGKPLPVSLIDTRGIFSQNAVEQAGLISKAYPFLQPVLDVLSWILFLTPGEMPAALSWLQENAQALKVILKEKIGTEARIAVLILWELARRDGSARLEPLLHFIGNPLAFTLSTHGTDQYLEAWINLLSHSRWEKRPTNAPAFPVPTFGNELLAFAKRLQQEDQATRRRAFDLFAQMLPSDILHRWQQWWTKVNTLTQQANSITVITAKKQFKEARKDIRAGLEAIRKEHPPFIHTEQLLSLVQEAAKQENSRFYNHIHQALKQLPQVQAGKLVRPAFLYDWLGIGKQYPNKCIKLIACFVDFLSKYRQVPEILNLWGSLLDFWNRTDLDFYFRSFNWDMLDFPETSYWPQVFETIGECFIFRNGDLSEDDKDLVISLVQATHDTKISVSYFRELVAAGLNEEYISLEVLRCAHRLSGTPEEFAQLSAALDGAETQYDDIIETVTKITQILERAAWPELVRERILDKDWKDLHTVGYLVDAVSALNADIEPPMVAKPESTPGWIEYYPTEFAEQLILLASLTPDAERKTSGILGKNFPRPQKLQQQIAAIMERIQERPDDNALLKRLNNLRARLASPPTVSPVRLARLKTKLARAAQKAFLQVWQQRLEHTLRLKIIELLEVPEAPEWLFQPGQLHILTSLLKLSPAFRKLGFDLLRIRCGPPPWQLTENPANRNFLSQLRKQGIDTKPWIYPEHPWKFKAPNDRQVELRFEHDPLEIFRMGEYFNTCLSPGSCNFFSTIANCVDVNKHVVYAKDEHNRVVGRCLLALSKDGHLLTFEPYCHDKSLGFDKMIAELVETLAAKMSTVVAPHGDVHCLVAPDWYDDGPVDICKRFTFLERGSTFRQSLQQISPDQFIPILTDAFDPLPLNALTLPFVLDLEELHDRPDLFRPLIPYINKCHSLPEKAWLQAASLAHKAGAVGFLHRGLWRQIVPFLINLYNHDWSDVIETIDRFVEIAPSAVIQVLRRTRPRGVRSDEEETDIERLELLAKANGYLRRPARAERLRKLIKKNSIA